MCVDVIERIVHGLVMQWRGLALGAALSLSAACGDLIGEPIIRGDAQASVEAEREDNHDHDSSRDSGSVSISTGGSALCEPCESDSDCGWWNDLCLTNDDTGQRFCGRDCLQGQGCPDGYACFVVNDADDSTQCAPVSGSCSEAAADAGSIFGSASLAEMRAYVLDLLNQMRIYQGLPPFEADTCLDQLAQAATIELIDEGRYHTLFQRQCDWSDEPCECGWTDESQSIASWNELDWRQSINRAVFEMMAEDPSGATVGNILSPSFDRAGVGIVVGEYRIWQSVEFGAR